MLNSKKCSLLINTCDNYEDTWIPFFHCCPIIGGSVRTQYI